MTRDIPPSEVKELLEIRPDPLKYPEEANKKVAKKLHEHHFFTLLGGNPQSIILIAPLLADMDKNICLSTLY
jgi:hypothetical protein